MKKIGRSLLQVFSISIQLKEKKVITLSCNVGPEGTIDDGNVGTNGTIGTNGNIGTNGTNTNGTGDPLSSPVNQEAADTHVELFGTVKAMVGPFISEYLYNRTDENPEHIDSEDNFLSISGPSEGCPGFLGLDLQFNLRDAHRGIEISRGWLAYEDHHPEAYIDKRLSTVVEGEHGWATVYYTLFSKAIQACVSVRFVFNRGSEVSPCVVSGSLFLGYSGHDYRFEYQRNCYRTVLFKKSEQDGELIYGGDSLLVPLQSRLVAVPMNTSLIMEADLHFKSNATVVATVSAQNAELPQPKHISDAPEFKNIPGVNGYLEVIVRWSLG